jgi:hypothetical protein
MRKGVVLVLMLGLTLSLAAGCAPSPATVNPGQAFNLGIGQSAAVAGYGLTVTFRSVQEDSRCPTGAT